MCGTGRRMYCTVNSARAPAPISRPKMTSVDEWAPTKMRDMATMTTSIQLHARRIGRCHTGLWRATTMASAPYTIALMLACPLGLMDTMPQAAEHVSNANLRMAVMHAQIASDPKSQNAARRDWKPHIRAARINDKGSRTATSTRSVIAVSQFNGGLLARPRIESDHRLLEDQRYSQHR